MASDKLIFKDRRVQVGILPAVSIDYDNAWQASIPVVYPSVFPRETPYKVNFGRQFELVYL